MPTTANPNPPIPSHQKIDTPPPSKKQQQQNTQTNKNITRTETSSKGRILMDSGTQGGATENMHSVASFRIFSFLCHTLFCHTTDVKGMFSTLDHDCKCMHMHIRKLGINEQRKIMKENISEIWLFDSPSKTMVLPQTVDDMTGMNFLK